MMLKPSELSPLSAILLAEMIDEADFPPGTFNLVNGDGAGVGAHLTVARGRGHGQLHRINACRGGDQLKQLRQIP